MSREIDKLRNAIVPRRGQVQERQETQESVPAPLPLQPGRGFFTFRYSSTEIYTQGGDLHVKMRETRYQDGRLQSEECEGTVDRQVYERMVSEAQGYFLNQMAGFARLLLAPFSLHDRRYDEDRRK